MNKRIRTGLVSLALVGGSVAGVTALGTSASAQVDDTVTTDQPVQPDQPDDEAPRRPGRHHDGGASLDAVAEVIGVDAEEIRTQLRDGATLAEIAEANGASVDAVVAAIVDAKQERLADAVEQGRLTQTEADERAADLEERVATRVEEGRPERPDRPERPERPDVADDAPAPTDG